jgi:hypothetical protein
MQQRLAETREVEVVEAQALDVTKIVTKIPKTRREYFSLIVVSTHLHPQSRFGNQARFV